MSVEALGERVVEFVRTHEAWAVPVAFALTFSESLAFVSLIVPAWAALVAIGALVGASGIEFWPVWVAASIGAALGDWVSYWVGRKLDRASYERWPLSRYPDLVRKGEAFVRKWGVLAIVIGRFFGPLRSIVPLVAGIFGMPRWRYQVANVLSAFAWTAMLLQLSNLGSQFVIRHWR